MKQHEWARTKPMWVIGTIDSQGAIRARASKGRDNPIHGKDDGPGHRWRWNVWGQEFHAVMGGASTMKQEEYETVTNWLTVNGYVYENTTTVTPVGRRGQQPTYQAKIGTMSGSIIIVKRARKFKVGQRIEFADTLDLRGCSVSVAPKWRTGTIWLIEDDRLFINLN